MYPNKHDYLTIYLKSLNENVSADPIIYIRNYKSNDCYRAECIVFIFTLFFLFF